MLVNRYSAKQWIEATRDEGEEEEDDDDDPSHAARARGRRARPFYAMNRDSCRYVNI